MPKLTRKEVLQLIRTAFKEHHPINWRWWGDKLISPSIYNTPTSLYYIAIHTDSRWWPTVSVEGTYVSGSIRFWWPFCRPAAFLRERLEIRERDRLEQRKMLLRHLEHLQKKRHKLR